VHEYYGDVEEEYWYSIKDGEEEVKEEDVQITSLIFRSL
jgi:hypothetical protein